MKDSIISNWAATHIIVLYITGVLFYALALPLGVYLSHPKPHK